MRRVVITGMGLVSSLGNDLHTVSDSLRYGRSGIRFNPAYADIGMRSQISGALNINLDEIPVDRKVRRFMGDAALYAYFSMQNAIRDAGLEHSEVSHPRTGLIAGSGATSSLTHMDALKTLQEKGISRVGPFRVPPIMSSAVSAALATPFRIKGISYSLASACATSAHCIGHAMELIRNGSQDIIFAGGGEEEHWTLSYLFDAMGALSTRYNDTPPLASRPYDVKRDGFVISGGGGMLVLESLEHAQARGAHIHAELVGYGATSDGYDMVAPSGEGSVRCMQLALDGLHEPVDYINTHGTSTPAGDLAELRSIRKAFGNKVPLLSSTKSLSGHALGAAGVHEVIYSLLMMRHEFIAGSANIQQPDPELGDMPVLRECRENHRIDTVMSNSFGFGGTNASLVLRRWQD